MPTQIPMTKGNLLRLKHSYDLAKNGFDGSQAKYLNQGNDGDGRKGQGTS